MGVRNHCFIFTPIMINYCTIGTGFLVLFLYIYFVFLYNLVCVGISQPFLCYSPNESGWLGQRTFALDRSGIDYLMLAGNYIQTYSLYLPHRTLRMKKILLTNTN
jgi:hypothetical protein